MRKKRASPRKLKPRYAIVVEGECEFWYIQMLKRNERSLGVNIEPKIPQRKKLEDQFTNAISLSNDYKHVFWIIDFDTIIAETRKTKRGEKTAIETFKEIKAKINMRHQNITIIINNPCVEFWILLHFESTSKCFSSCNDAIKQLKKHFKDYEKTQRFYTQQNKDIYLRLKPHLNEAIENANKLGKFDPDQPNTGITEMQLLFETKEILKIIKKKNKAKC
ncbi:MAG: RloB family protein [Ginsengibacter sp.]